MILLPRNLLSLTLFLSIALSSLSAEGSLQHVHRRDHKMIKARALTPLVDTPVTSTSGKSTNNLASNNLGSNNAADSFPPVVGAAANPNAQTTADTDTTVAAKPTTADTPAVVPAPTSITIKATDVAATTETPTVVPNTALTTTTTTTTPLAATAKTSSTTSTTSSTPTSSTPSQTPNLTAAPAPTETALAANPRVTVINTTTAEPTPSATAAASTNTGVSTTKKATITILIVIAASVGGAAIIWTIIRKWKFKPSSQFEDRMQPIDWQPSGVEDSGISGNARRHSGASSHRSGGDAPAGIGANADYGHGAYGGALGPLPDHDFTAGNQRGLAPVGGYADLNRGPSPGPQMADLSQGPMYHPQYEQYSTGQVPLHHQNAYGAHDAYDYNGNGSRY